jgi:hypothetical protein
LTTTSFDVIEAVKHAALDDDTSAWEAMGKTARQWLDQRKSTAKKA